MFGARHRRGCVTIVAVLLFSTARTGALDFVTRGGTYSSARHDRFVAGTFPLNPVPNPNFFMAAYEPELSGVGWQTNDVQKKATLISPLHFLNANHYRLSGTITFRNQDGLLKTYTIQSNTQVLSTDIAIGRLSAPIPTEDRVPFFTLVDTDPVPWFGQEVMYVGRAPDNANFAAGRTVPNSELLQTYVFYNSALVSPEHAVDRCRGVTGDSGSPTFLEANGKLALVGHHVSGTGDVFLGYFRNAVDDLQLAPSRYLLQVANEWQAGDPQSGGLVVSRLPRAAGGQVLDFGVLSTLGLTQSVKFMLHNFSTGLRTITLQTNSPSFVPVLPVMILAGNGSRVEAEIIFSPLTWGVFNASLVVSDGFSNLTLPLTGSLMDGGMLPPTANLAPVSQSGGAQQTRNYTLSVTNNDIASNPATTFLVNVVPPADPSWIATVSPVSLYLAPGATGTATISVTSPPLSADVPAGTYAFGVSVTDNLAEPAHAAVATGQFVLVTRAVELVESLEP